MSDIKECFTCEYYASIEGVCCNGDSIHRADFVRPYTTCEQWTSENKEEAQNG